MKGDDTMDAMVLMSQQWMNKTYGNDNRYTKVVEDGLTGWGTINGLIIAMQIELGMTETAAIIGPNTRNKFNVKYPNGIKEQSDNDERTDNMHGIIQCALWCKGYYAELGSITGQYKGQTAASVKELKSDIGFTSGVTSTVTIEIMEQLLSMKQFVLLSNQGGRSVIRSIQQKINREYKNYTGIIPCDGLYGREMNTAIIQVLQAVEGFGPEVSNGNFGNGTKGALKIITSSNSAQNPNWVWIASVALVCNKYLSSTTTIWTSSLEDAIAKFQSDYALPITRQVDINTWMSLFISKGNPDRIAKACDTRFEITDSLAKKLKSDGYEIVGRYLTGGDFKEIREGELERILSYGLKYFPIFQEVGTNESNYTYQKGKESAERAISAAIRHGIPSTVIYFAVDFDAMDYQVTNSILPYFKGVSEHMGTAYKVGIYAPRNVCTRVCNAGYAVSSFVSDMSTGYSGNLGFTIPENWNYDQFHEIKGYLGTTDLDKVAYSGRIPACSEVTKFNIRDYTPPATPDTSSIKDTIFDVIVLIKQLEQAYGDFKTRYQDFASSSEYKPKDSIAAGVLNYLSLRYLEDKEFMIAIQTPDLTFKYFMQLEYPTLASSINKYVGSNNVTVKDNIGGKNDIAHLAVSTLAYSDFSLAPDFWAAWGGDLATGMSDVHDYVKRTGIDISTASDALIGADEHPSGPGFALRCNYTDLCDDADAIALSRALENNSSSTYALSNAMENYYSELTTQKRYLQYSYDGLDFSSLQELAYSVGAKMLGASSQLLVVFWELSTSIEKAHSCVSFACYLWNKIH